MQTEIQTHTITEVEALKMRAHSKRLNATQIAFTNLVVTRIRLAKEIEAIDAVPGPGESLTPVAQNERDDMESALLIIGEMMNWDTLTKITSKALKNKI